MAKSPQKMTPGSPATVPGHRAGVRPSNAGIKLPAEVYTKDEVQRLLKVPSPTAPTGIRNRALLILMYRAGLRVSEALALEVRDVDAQACSLRVRHGKGDRARTIGMDPSAFSVLQRWLDVRSRLAISS